MSLQLDFQLKDKEGDLGTYVTNGEWDLLGRSLNPTEEVFSAFNISI